MPVYDRGGHTGITRFYRLAMTGERNMALNCGVNNLGIGAGGGDINVNPVVAILVAFVKFIQQLLISWNQAQAFVNQQCPGNCPKKTVVGPTIGNPRFSLNFSKKKGTWQAGFACTVKARVTCGAAPKAPKK
jgi:hypothetical protein